MEGRDEEVEADGPEGEDGEEGKGAGGDAAAGLGGVGASVDDAEEACHEDVNSLNVCRLDI